MLDESELYDSVESIETFFMSVDISQDIEKWGAKSEVKRMDTKERNMLLKWRASYETELLDNSYKIHVSTIQNKGLIKWALAAINWLKKAEHLAKATSPAKDQ